MKLKNVWFEDGTWHWQCVAGDAWKQYECRYAIQIGFWVSAFMMLLGLLILRDGEILLMLLSCGITMLIAITCGHFLLKRKTCEILPFTMTEKGIRIKEGKESSYVRFRSVRYAETRENQVILHTRFSTVPVSIPLEDFTAVYCLIEEFIAKSGKTFTL